MLKIKVLQSLSGTIYCLRAYMTQAMIASAANNVCQRFDLELKICAARLFMIARPEYLIEHD